MQQEAFQTVSEAVARHLGIERFFAEVLSADKARHVQELQAEVKRVAMLGVRRPPSRR